MTPEQIAVQLERHEQEIKSLVRRTNRCEENFATLHKMATSVETLALNMKFMAEEQKKQGERLETLERKPSDDYQYYKRFILGCVFTSVISAVMGAILATVL